MRLHWQRLSPSSAAAMLLGAGLLLLLLRQFLAANTERAPPLQAVALLAPPPPAEQQPAPEEKRPQEEPQALRTLDSSEWAAATGPGPAGSGAPDPGFPASGPLGLDEAGSGGSDAFGLAGRPGGRELLLTTESGGGGGNPSARFARFADQLQSHITKELNEHAELRRTCYSVNVDVKVAATGMIEDVRIRKSTGQSALDSEIREAFAMLTPVNAAPPPDMPWPIALRVVSHGRQCEPQNVAPAESAPTPR